MASPSQVRPNFCEQPLKAGIPRSEPIDIPSSRKRTASFDVANVGLSRSGRSTPVGAGQPNWGARPLRLEARPFEVKPLRLAQTEATPPKRIKKQKYVYVPKTEFEAPEQADPLQKPAPMDPGVTRLLQATLKKLEKVEHHQKVRECLAANQTPPPPPVKTRLRPRAHSMQGPCVTRSRPIPIPRRLVEEDLAGPCALLAEHLEHKLLMRQQSEPVPSQYLSDGSSSEEEDDESRLEDPEHRQSRRSYRSWRRYGLSRQVRLGLDSASGSEDEAEQGHYTTYSSPASLNHPNVIQLLYEEEIPPNARDHFRFVLNEIPPPM